MKPTRPSARARRATGSTAAYTSHIRPAGAQLAAATPAWAAGGAATPFALAGIQRKIQIGPADDAYEREADRVADRVVGGGTVDAASISRLPAAGLNPPAQRQVEEEAEAEAEEEEAVQTLAVQRQAEAEREEEEPVQTMPLQRQAEEEESEEAPQAKAAFGQPSAASRNLASDIEAQKAGGEPLGGATRAYFEPGFGRDFGNVRVHTDAHAGDTARAIGARAFTAGRDVFFAQGEYNPGHSSGRQLLAHELTHVVQQAGGRGGTLAFDRMPDRSGQRPEGAGRDGPYVQRQTAEEREEFERDQQEVAAGIQAKRVAATSLQRAPKGPYLQREKAASERATLLTSEEIGQARDWYAKKSSKYTAGVIKQIQTRIDVAVDGIIGPVTVRSIARWQSDNKLTVDGKAGATTLVAMFGRDVRAGTARPHEEPAARATKEPGLFDFLEPWLKYFGFSDEQTADLVEGKEPRSAASAAAPEPATKAKKRRFKLKVPKSFSKELDGVSLESSLLDKMNRMAAHALDNDLVTGDVVFSSGMRSPAKAHRWSTAYQIRQGAVPLKDLKALPDGKDKGGNVWYEPGWGIKQVKQNARKIWKGALAAEGYPKGDEKRKPNTFTGRVTRHATGKAIDATFLWNWSKGGQEKTKSEADFDKLKKAIEKRHAKNPDKKTKVLAAIEKYAGRGSYSAVAYKTVDDFALKRPVLHATGSPEDWHYEEKGK